jgi:hypothetical protein
LAKLKGRKKPLQASSHFDQKALGIVGVTNHWSLGKHESMNMVDSKTTDETSEVRKKMEKGKREVLKTQEGIQVSPYKSSATTSEVVLIFFARYQQEWVVKRSNILYLSSS